MLNKQGEGKINWTDFTWNPISGCLHNCEYCYMRAMKRFNPDIMAPGFRPNYLTDFERTRKVKPGDRIFVGSSGDMWGVWVDDDHINRVLHVVQDNSQYTFQFLTKNPERYADFLLPKNAWYGTSFDGTDNTQGNIFKLSKAIASDRLKFVSFEPLLSEPFAPLNYLSWIIIGANSNKGAAKPPDWWADNLIADAKMLNIPVFVKSNYNYPVKIEEFPEWINTKNI